MGVAAFAGRGRRGDQLRRGLAVARRLQSRAEGVGPTRNRKNARPCVYSASRSDSTLMPEERKTFRSAALVRQARQRRLHPSQLDAQPGPARRRVRRPAGHRHLQHLVGADALQRALPRPRRARQARRLGSGRPAASSSRSCRPARPNMRPTAMLFRNLRQHGRRGVDPRQPDRRRRAALRLRQDHAVAGDGRRQLRPAGDRRLGRPDAERQVPRPGHRLGHRRLAVQRGRQGRRDEPRASSWTPRPCMSRSAGHCMRDGHGLDDGVDGRSAGHGAAAQRRHSAVDSRRYALAHLAGRRIVEMVQRGRADLADPDARGVRERHPRQRRHRRLDQRRHPPAGDGRPRRRAADARRLGPARHATCRRWSTSCRRAGS